MAAVLIFGLKPRLLKFIILLMTKSHDDNIALLIDADNIGASGLDPVLTALAELGTVNIRRAYGNWTKSALKGWSGILHKYGIEPQQQFDITKGKNATDMKMTIDAMDLLFRGNVSGFGIMSSDSDFMPLAMRIRQEGIPVYGFGSAKTPEGFRQACSRFIDVDALMKAESNDDSGKVDEDLQKLLVDAYKASSRDEKGFASLSEVGKLAGNRSSFDVRNYGFTKLVDMFDAVPSFDVQRREGGGVWVRRLR